MVTQSKRIWIWIASITLIFSTLYFGFSLGRFYSTSDQNLAAIQEAWRIIHQEYVEPGSIDSAALSQAAIQAMMDTLNDSHSAYLDQQSFHAFLDELMGSYEGIGISYTLEEGKFIVVRVFLGTPAERAGLMPGDLILEINGKSTSGMSDREFSELMKGASGTTVSLLIQHQNTAQKVPVSIVREVVQFPSVYFEMIGDIAYIEIIQFGETANDELGLALQKVSTSGAKGIIVDLRDNPGGFVHSAVDTVSRFVKSGTVFTEVSKDGTKKVYNVTSQPEKTDLPVVVLVNRNSASASEIFCGALQDHGRAVIAGEVTYGKGSVNQLYELPDGTAIYLTVARWLTPNGDLIEGNGVTPDKDLSRENDWRKWAIDYLLEQ